MIIIIFRKLYGVHNEESAFFCNLTMGRRGKHLVKEAFRKMLGSLYKKCLWLTSSNGDVNYARVSSVGISMSENSSYTSASVVAPQAPTPELQCCGKDCDHFYTEEHKWVQAMEHHQPGMMNGVHMLTIFSKIHWIDASCGGIDFFEDQQVVRKRMRLLKRTRRKYTHKRSWTNQIWRHEEHEVPRWNFNCRVKRSLQDSVDCHEAYE